MPRSRSRSPNPPLRPGGHEKRKSVLLNLSSRHLRRLQKHLSQLSHSMPPLADLLSSSRTISRDWCDLVISRLLNWGVSLRVARGELRLVYDTPIELQQQGKLDVLETVLVVVMGLVESVTRASSAKWTQSPATWKKGTGKYPEI